jgi:hypothetical protein
MTATAALAAQRHVCQCRMHKLHTNCPITMPYHRWCSTDVFVPSMEVSYPCEDGATSLSRVLVKNRRDCCQERIIRFSMDFLNATGGEDRPSYEFKDGRITFSIDVKGG